MQGQSTSLNPVQAAAQSVVKVGLDAIQRDALTLVSLLARAPAHKDTAIALVALCRICRENVFPRDIASHVASFAGSVPNALKYILGKNADRIEAKLLAGHDDANEPINAAIAALDIAKRWQPMLKACGRIDPISQIRDW